MVEVDHPERGPYLTVGCPIKLSDSPAEITRPPELGEHSGDLLQELAGVSAEEVAKLREDGVI